MKTFKKYRKMNSKVHKNEGAKIEKSSKRKYYLASVFLLLLVAIPLFNNHYAQTATDELSGSTFNISYPTPDARNDDPNGYDSLMTVEFSDGEAATPSIQDGDGTYELNGDVLTLQFENENESLQIEFSLKESEQDFSEYSAVIRDVDFEKKNPDDISHFQNLFYKLNKKLPLEFIKRQS